MDYLIDHLYNFSVSLTCQIHDWGTIENIKMFVNEYCSEQKITREENIKVIKHYSKYYMKNNITWFPTRDDIEEWYINYKMKK